MRAVVAGGDAQNSRGVCRARPERAHQIASELPIGVDRTQGAILISEGLAHPYI
jgi:hypothetical protein